MSDPTPRPPAGTDLAPCPDCGGDIDTKASEDSDGQWWDLECDGCGWLAQVVDDLAPFTLAGAPWTRALWAEVERLRAEAAELRLELAAEQGRQEGAPSAGWEYDPSEHSWRRYTTGRGWSCVYRDRNSTDGISEWGSDSNRGAPAPTMRAAMKAADEAEAQAAAKEPTP